MLLKRRVPFLHLKSYYTNKHTRFIVHDKYGDISTLKWGITCIITSLVCWPEGPPSGSRRNLPTGTWTQRETTAELGSSPPSACRNAPGRWCYRTAALTEESRTIQRETQHHIMWLASISLCVTVKLLFLCLGYRWWRVDHSHIITILEWWTKCRYERCQHQDHS